MGVGVMMMMRLLQCLWLRPVTGRRPMQISDVPLLSFGIAVKVAHAILGTGVACVENWGRSLGMNKRSFFPRLSLFIPTAGLLVIRVWAELRCFIHLLIVPRRRHRRRRVW